MLGWAQALCLVPRASRSLMGRVCIEVEAVASSLLTDVGSVWASVVWVWIVIMPVGMWVPWPVWVPV